MCEVRVTIDITFVNDSTYSIENLIYIPALSPSLDDDIRAFCSMNIDDDALLSGLRAIHFCRLPD